MPVFIVIFTNVYTYCQLATNMRSNYSDYAIRLHILRDLKYLAIITPKGVGYF